MKQQPVVLMRDGKECLFGIEWKVVRSPCSVDDISQIKTDGRVYLMLADVDSKNIFYRSEDGVHWKRVLLDSPEFEVLANGKISIENGVWIVRNNETGNRSRPSGFYYSNDAINWQYGEPMGGTDLSLSQGGRWLGDLIYFNDMWLWQVTEGRPYDYVEKGFFSDTKKTSFCTTVALYCASDLDGLWERWDNIPEVPMGIEIKAFHSISDGSVLLAFCEQDSFYIDRKKKSKQKPFSLRLEMGEHWDDCEWDDDVSTSYQVFSKINDKLVCSNYHGTFTSEDGLRWRMQEQGLDIEFLYSLKSLNLLIGLENRSLNGAICVTQDGATFNKLLDEEGSWRRLAAGEDGVVGIYHRHGSDYEEDTLQFGSYIFQDKG